MTSTDDLRGPAVAWAWGVQAWRATSLWTAGGIWLALSGAMDHIPDVAHDGLPLVMVADADTETGRALASYLVRRGFRARHTALGEDVLGLAHDGRLAMVIVDVALRDMSGHTLVSQLKEIDPRLPVLMTTGDYRPELEVRARQIGILHYAQKPAEPERLEAVVTKAIGALRSA